MAYRDQDTGSKKAAGWDGQYADTCRAYGCFLPAGIITHYQPYSGSGNNRLLPSEGVCGFHWAAAGDHWQDVTHVLRRYRVLLEVLGRIDRLPMIDRLRMVPAMVDGDVDTTPREGETMGQWSMRMRSLVKDRIRDRLSQRRSDTVVHDVAPNMESIVRQVVRDCGSD